MTKLSEFEMIDLIVELAQQVESADPIDWAFFNCGEEETYKLIAAGVIESINGVESKDEKIISLLATVTKLVVENTVLHQQLASR